MRFASRAGKALHMALHTLRKMAAGGVHDAVGGGFHRYSVDDLWHIPHFEKMMCAPFNLCQTLVCIRRVPKDDPLWCEQQQIAMHLHRKITHLRIRSGARLRDCLALPR